MKKLSIPTLLLFLLLFLVKFSVVRVFAAQSCGTNIDQCTVNLSTKHDTATTNYPTNLNTTLDGSHPTTQFTDHTITWNGCTPSSTCAGPVSFSYHAQAQDPTGFNVTISISLTGTGTWSNGAIQYSVTGGDCTVYNYPFPGDQSTAAVLD